MNRSTHSKSMHWCCGWFLCMCVSVISLLERRILIALISTAKPSQTGDLTRPIHTIHSYGFIHCNITRKPNEFIAGQRGDLCKFQRSIPIVIPNQPAARSQLIYELFESHTYTFVCMRLNNHGVYDVVKLRGPQQFMHNLQYICSYTTGTHHHHHWN